jgi:sigma-E factor negative regulatory protein RseA
MSEKMRESLSALMDGESNELELQRVLSALDKDASLKKTWQRYHAVRAVVSENTHGDFSMDISSRVTEAIALEGERHSPGAVTRMLKPLASFAVAASVAAVVVVGGQQLAQLGDPGSAGNTIASGISPVGVINIDGAMPVQASYGTRSVPVLQPTTGTAYKELARQRMQKYIQEHAEHAALNSPQGLVPFARVQKIKE